MGQGVVHRKVIVNGTENMTLASLSFHFYKTYSFLAQLGGEAVLESARRQLKGRIRRQWMRWWKTSCPLILSFLRLLAFQAKQDIVELCSPQDIASKFSAKGFCQRNRKESWQLLVSDQMQEYFNLWSLWL